MFLSSFFFPGCHRSPGLEPRGHPIPPGGEDSVRSADGDQLEEALDGEAVRGRKQGEHDAVCYVCSNNVVERGWGWSVLIPLAEFLKF